MSTGTYKTPPPYLCLPRYITTGLQAFTKSYCQLDWTSVTSKAGNISIMFGFGASTFSAADIPDLSGKVILVTGGMRVLSLEVVCYDHHSGWLSGISLHGLALPWASN